MPSCAVLDVCDTVLCCAIMCCALLSLDTALCRAAQMHHIEDVAVVSILGTVGMLAAMGVVVGKLIAIFLSTPQPAPTELVASGVSFQVGVGGLHSSLHSR